MFNLQGGELMIILLLALVVLGPEKLPDAMRKLGKLYGEFKRMSAGFQSEFRQAVDEPIREFRKAVDEPIRELRDTANALRDSADFTKLRDGERNEKPKSAEMTNAEIADMLVPMDPNVKPATVIPTFETDEPETAEPETAEPAETAEPEPVLGEPGPAPEADTADGEQA